MTTIVFNTVHNYDYDALLEQVSLLLLIPNENLTMTRIYWGDVRNKKLTNLNCDSLLGYIACKEHQLTTATLVKTRGNLSTDKYLHTFDKIYVGCVNGNPPKSELVARISKMRKIEQTKRLPNYFHGVPPWRLEKELADAELSKAELKEIEDIASAGKTLMTNWMEKRLATIESSEPKYKALLRKNF